jgi:hypothetical protein
MRMILWERNMPLYYIKIKWKIQPNNLEFAKFPFGGPFLQHTHLLQTCMNRIHNNLMEKWRPQESIEIESLTQLFSLFLHKFLAYFLDYLLNLFHEKSIIL